MNNRLEMHQLSSLAKVFPAKIYGSESHRRICFKGQDISYQIALMGKGDYTFHIESALNEYIKVYKVLYVPSGMSAYPQSHDDNYLTLEGGMFPDPLLPKNDRNISLTEGEFYTLWLNIHIPRHISSMEYPIAFSLKKDGDEIERSIFTVDIQNECIPDQELIFTQWFHTDCIADVHGVEVFSNEHWMLIEKYIKIACEHGMNMLLTPLFTPPLDTVVGGERTTVQLVDVAKENGVYSFNTEKLKKFINLATRCGIKYFELSHFFTQWGAAATPKIMATVDGEYKRIFGWDIEATDPEYARFLSEFIPAVLNTFDQCGIERDRIYMHVSDEPNEKNIDSYRRAHKILMPLLDGCNHIDALSHFEFLEQGLVDVPVVGIDALEPFIESGADNLWCYYCCAQTKLVANRFFSMPSARNRIIGTQIFKYDMKGFLHWGYNFYNSQLSKSKIDPYLVTDAGGGFPSGDAFSVYPYEDGVIPSLRMKVFKEAIDDIGALRLLSQKIGKDKAVELLDTVAKCDLTFKEYPRDEEFFEALYKKMLECI